MILVSRLVKTLLASVLMTETQYMKSSWLDSLPMGTIVVSKKRYFEDDRYCWELNLKLLNPRK